MKDLKIYSLDEVQEPLLLKLDHDIDGGVMLIAVTSKGENIHRNCLLTLRANGILYLSKNINSNLDLPLDDEYRLKLENYEEKAPVTFSDDELKALAIIRSKLQEEYLSTTNRDVHTNLQLCISVLEKMIEAFQPIDTPRTRGELND